MTQSIKRQITLFLFVFGALFAFAGVNYASAQEAVGTVVITYDSNPDEVLGEFDIVPFSEELLLERVADLNANFEKMRVALGGGVVDCAAFMMGYEAVLEDSVFFDGVPVRYQEADTLYQLAFVTALDRTRPAYLSCLNSGGVSDFNYGLAFTSLADAIELGKRAQAIAEDVSGQPAPPPMEDMDEGDMGEDGDMGEPEMEDMTGNAVTVRWTDIFSAPDPSASTGMSLPPKTRVDVIMTEGAWAQIESDMGNGFVPTNALDFDAEPLPEPPAPEEEMDDMDDMDEMDDEDMDTPIDDGGPVTEDVLDRVLEDIYLDWDGETRSPRVSSAFGNNSANAEFIRPAVVNFDALTFDAVVQISFVFNAVYVDIINQALDGESTDCDDFIIGHLLIGKSPEFTNVPGQYQGFVARYEAAVTEFLRVTEPLALGCLDNQFPSDAMLNAARQGVGETFADFFELVISVEGERSGFIME